MNADRKKELKEDYNNRHPHKGIVSWKSGDNIGSIAFSGVGQK